MTGAEGTRRSQADHAKFRTGPFRGLPTSDAFAASASSQEPVVVMLGEIPWPAGLAPAPTAFGTYHAGEAITTAVEANVDALVVLYTDEETSALLEVFTGNNEWSSARSKTWCGYGHNFARFKSQIDDIGDDTALKEGFFGYLSAVKIGSKTVALYKTELHPKQDGPQLPFVGVMQQLIGELKPPVVISTGTAGAVGGTLQCGDVAITSRARFHTRSSYPDYPDIATMTANDTELSSAFTVNDQYVNYAATNLTKLSLSGLGQCYTKLQESSGYSFVARNTAAPQIYVTNEDAVPGPQPMDIVTADYLTVDDRLDAEGLQSLGVMNDTDDAFLFYAISTMTGSQPQWLSVRNASEPQIVVPAFPAGTSAATITSKLGSVAGPIYGIYQYCTTLNSAFACWGVIAGM